MRKSLLFPLGLLVLFFILTSAACSFSTDASDEPQVIVITATPQTVATDTPIEEAMEDPTEAATEEATDAQIETSATATQTPFFTEEFDTNFDNYYYDIDHYPYEVGKLRGDMKLANVTMNGGQVRFNLNDKLLWPYILYRPFYYTDVRVDVNADNLATNDHTVSIICRYDQELGWYEFLFSAGGKLQIAFFDNVLSKNYHNLYDGGSEAIRMGKDNNTYTAICKGNQLTVMVNGVLVKTIEHKDLKKGYVGTGVYSYENYPVKVYINSMKISQP